MTAAPILLRALALLAGLLLLVGELKACKFAVLGPTRRLSRADLRDLALLTAALLTLATLVAQLGGSALAGAAVASAAGLLLLLGLLLDTVLFRLFTIELGPGGVGGVVLSELYREVAGMGHARRFLREHRFLLGWPLAAALALVPLWPVGTGTAALALALLLLRAALLRAATLRRRDPGESSVERPPCPLLGSPALVRDFIWPRPLPLPAGFTPRPDDVCRLPGRPRPPGRSPHHGSLAGTDVVLVTLESLAPGARLPFLDSLRARGVTSLHHACITPLTNDAHLALYRGGYPAQGPALLVEGFGAAGYQRAYLTPARTAHYGLQGLLVAAGFDLIVDEGTLAPGAREPLPDEVVAGAGLEALAAELDPERPLFLHVHTAATHLPYRVADRQRRLALDPDDDRGRLLAGLQEADATVAELCTRLTALRGRPPLLVLTGDHGQSFGEHGYHSHGSSIHREQLVVPLVIHHPGLAAAQVPFSSHLDVLPTLLDLVGVDVSLPLHGQSLLLPDRVADPLLVWAGAPSRSRCSHLGLISPGEKLLLDLCTRRCQRLDLDDRRAHELDGDERAHTVALIAWTAARLGVH